MAMLRVTRGSELIRELTLEDGMSVRIGREDGNTIVLDDEAVTEEHALLKVMGDRYSLVDLTSTNGTWMNGSRVHETFVEEGDEISIRPYTLSLIGTSKHKPAKTRILDVQGGSTGAAPGTKPLDSMNKPVLIVERSSSGQVGKEFEIPEQRNPIIGRESSCDFVVDDDTVSRRHARLFRTDEGRYQLSDMQSQSGTRVDGRLLTGPTLLCNGNKIQVGKTVLRAENVGGDAAPTKHIDKDDEDKGELGKKPDVGRRIWPAVFGSLAVLAVVYFVGWFIIGVLPPQLDPDIGRDMMKTADRYYDEARYASAEAEYDSAAGFFEDVRGRPMGRDDASGRLLRQAKLGVKLSGWMDLAKEAYNQGDYKEARSYAERVLAERNGDVRASALIDAIPAPKIRVPDPLPDVVHPEPDELDPAELVLAEIEELEGRIADAYYVAHNLAGVVNLAERLDKVDPGNEVAYRFERLADLEDKAIENGESGNRGLAVRLAEEMLLLDQGNRWAREIIAENDCDEDRCRELVAEAQYVRTFGLRDNPMAPASAIRAEERRLLLEAQKWCCDRAGDPSSRQLAEAVRGRLEELDGQLR